jgi:hypothetical protein
MIDKTVQEVWDAALIAEWRLDADIFYCRSKFHVETGAYPDETLLRMPHPGSPWAMRVRLFVAQHLPLISARLWDQPPARDAAMLAKLATSKYTTHKPMRTDADREMDRERKADKKAHEVVKLTRHIIGLQKNATDWNVVGANTKHRRMRG